MLYQAIAAGAKGIMHYSFRTGAGTLAQAAPALWAETGRTAAEIARITPYLTAGRMIRHGLGNGLVATTWTYRDSVLVLIVHVGGYRSHADPARNPADPRAISVALPAGTVGPVTSAFVGRPCTLTYADGRLGGTLDLLAVQACILHAR
jgi:hypothetical protein